MGVMILTSVPILREYQGKNKPVSIEVRWNNSNATNNDCVILFFFL